MTLINDGKAVINGGKAVIREWEDIKFHGDKNTKLYLEKDNFTANDIAFGNVLNLREVYDFGEKFENNKNFLGYINSFDEIPLEDLKKSEENFIVYKNIYKNSGDYTDNDLLIFISRNNFDYIYLYFDQLDGYVERGGGLNSSSIEDIKKIEYKDENDVWKEFVLDDNDAEGNSSTEGGSTGSEDGTNTEGSGTGAESQIIFNKINDNKPIMTKCYENDTAITSWPTEDITFDNTNCKFYIVDDNNLEMEINLNPGMFDDDKDYLIIKNSSSNSQITVKIGVKIGVYNKTLNNGEFVLVYYYIDYYDNIGYYSISDVLS